MSKPNHVIETSHWDSELEVRVTDDVAVITGYAAKFNTLSNNLGGFVEQVAPGFFDETVARSHDVRALFNHDANIVLGRTKNDTLKLLIDDTGLEYQVEGNMKADAVRNVVAYLERGDVSQSSFSFRMLEDDWSATDENYPLRTLIRGRTYDVGPATIPAYDDTDAGVRAALRSLSILSEQPLEDLVDAAGRDELRGLLLSTKTQPAIVPGADPPDEDDDPSPSTAELRRQLLAKRYAPTT